MATTNYDELMRIAAGGTELNPQTSMTAALSDAGSAKKYIDPSGITQSYYTTPTNAGNYESGRPVYAQSDAVKQAAEALKNQEASKPGAYQSQYGNQIQQLIDAALNRPKFNYDFAADPVYQQYADKYQQQGQMAMKGAMGAAAALTGGYGNSYATTVGQQTYQNYLTQMNDAIPQLREAAYQKYKDDEATLRNNLGMLQQQDESQYGRYRDTVSDYQNELNYFYGKYSDMSNQEYQRYANDSSAWLADRAYWYQKQYDEQQQRNWEAEFNARYADVGGGGGGGGGGHRRSGSDWKIGEKMSAYAGETNDDWSSKWSNASSKADEWMKKKTSKE